MKQYLHQILDYFTLSKEKNHLKFSFKISILFYLFFLVTQLIYNLIPNVVDEGIITISMFPFILTVIGSFIYFRRNFHNLKFEDYLKSSIIFSIMSIIIGYHAMVITLGEDFVDFIPFPLIILVYSLLLSVFFPREPLKSKLKNLFKVLLFVIIIYKFIKPYLGLDDDDDDSSNNSFDTDGDGVDDTFFLDSDGDGVNDTIALDSDGDGIIDTIAEDSDGDGLIDTVYSDNDGDGSIDSFLQDSDGDGIADSGFIDSDGDGTPDKLV
jgi:hypothetical protein